MLIKKLQNNKKILLKIKIHYQINKTSNKKSK